MTMQIMTVNGSIAPSELGACLTHEHLAIDMTSMSAPPTEESALEQYHAPMRAELVGVLRRSPFAVLANFTLDEDDILADELLAYRQLGGQSIVDVTPPCIGRDVRRLQRLSDATGLHVVAGSAYYIAAAQSAWVRDASVAQITERLVTEATQGIDGTTIRPGVLGEIGISARIEDSEKNVLRAAAAAHRETGLAISLHVFPHAAFAALDLLEREGVDLTRVVVGHCDGSLGTDPSLDVHRELAKRGCYLSFDTFGLETRMPAGIYSPVPLWAPGDGVRIQAILALLETGLAPQLLISHDTSQKTQLMKYGGFGYGYILRIIVPDLLSFGVSQHDIDLMLIDNPRRLLAH